MAVRPTVLLTQVLKRISDSHENEAFRLCVVLCHCCDRLLGSQFLELLTVALSGDRGAPHQLCEETAEILTRTLLHGKAPEQGHQHLQAIKLPHALHCLWVTFGEVR